MNLIKTMIEEKGFTNEILQFEQDGVNHTMPLAVVVEFIEQSPKSIQKQIKEILSKIDLANGDIMDFMRFIAKGITQL